MGRKLGFHLHSAFLLVPEDKKRWRGYPGELAFVARLGLFGYGHYPFWKFCSLSKLYAWIADPSAELERGSCRL
jgi:hypothetical protein